MCKTFSHLSDHSPFVYFCKTRRKFISTSCPTSSASPTISLHPWSLQARKQWWLLPRRWRRSGPSDSSPEGKALRCRWACGPWAVGTCSGQRPGLECCRYWLHFEAGLAHPVAGQRQSTILCRWHRRQSTWRSCLSFHTTLSRRPPLLLCLPFPRIMYKNNSFHLRNSKAITIYITF